MPLGRLYMDQANLHIHRTESNNFNTFFRNDKKTNQKIE